jgi:hypothetical protein
MAKDSETSLLHLCAEVVCVVVMLLEEGLPFTMV